ncbi:uncharacterized protein LOC143194962 isoform X2 [Rhynchophorus ferrugineus]|uniref:uncharacterized protein LOC143194962 isoform X2 n=1 Tax=Rhynchophorus ferrugineus TaxID=354439 RepID=UPI003FCC52D8
MLWFSCNCLVAPKTVNHQQSKYITAITIMAGVKISISQILFICAVSSEWVEITQVERKPPESSTETIHETLLRRPNLYNFTITTKNSILSSTSMPQNEYSEESVARENEDNVDSEALEFESTSILTLFKQLNDNVLSFNDNSLDGKIKRLEELRDNLSYEIRNKINLLWKNDDHEHGRSYKDYLDYNHNMEFPSNEGALMSIGFLTFSVFLIKLVLKLIYTLKYKQRPDLLPVSSTTPASIFLKRNNRAIQDQIEEF